MSPFFEITPDMLEMLDDPIDRFNEALRREIKKRENDCYEEMAQVVVKYFPDTVCTGRSLRDRLNQLLAAEERLRSGDCNPGCANYPTCVHNHGRHGVARINCPLWRPKG